MALRSFLTRLGVGGAEIDAVLDVDRRRPGDTLEGTLHIRGGEQGKAASRAVVELVTRVTRETDNGEYVSDEAIAATEIPGPIRLGAEHAFDFELTLPAHTPVTTLGGHNLVWLRSGLDVPWAVDPSDVDHLDIYPTDAQANAIEAMSDLGFGLYKVDVEARSSWFGRRWVQEFEFRPTARGRRRYDGIEIVFEGQRGDTLDLLMQLDRAARGMGGLLREMSGADESWVRVCIDAGARASVAAGLHRVIG